MAAKNVKDEEDGDTRKKLELAAWVIGLLITPVMVTRTAGFGEGEMSLTFENTGLHFRAEKWARVH